jgi:flavin reductase (DIM6/NTAB) family NADH-FMN oxidoreductase RutF
MHQSLGPRTLAFPAPVWVIGSYGPDGRPNVMTASWAGICSSRPPSVTVSLRQATLTYHHLMARRAYTVSIPGAEHVQAADHFGLVSGRDEDKLAVAGLTAARATHVDAPYVAEFPVHLECRVSHTLEVGLHTLFVGEILDVAADPAVLDAEGLPSIPRVQPFVYVPEARDYYRVGEPLGAAFAIGRLLPHGR